MPTVGGFPTSATLAGARDINQVDFATAQENLGGKIELLISAINILNTNVSLIQAAVTSANASGVSFSAISGVTFTSTLAALSNFRA
jgi:hypothetical protein